MAGNVYVQPVLVQHPVQTDGQAARREMNKSTIYKLGVTEIILGIVFIVSCVVSIVLASGFAGYRYIGVILVSPGIWCGIFPIISGILGVMAQRNPSKCIFVANMIMAIFTSLFMAILFSLSIVSALVVSGYFGIILFQVLNCIGSFALFIVAIVHSSYCCSGICCDAFPQQARIPASHTIPAGQQFIQLPNGQFALVQNQPLVPQTYAAPQNMAPVWQPQVSVVQPETANQYPQGQMPPMNQNLKPATESVESPPCYDAHNFATNPNYM